MNYKQLPIFPLSTVLLPGGPLALRIFEARYLDMVSRCLREDSGFAVTLIHEGDEVGSAMFHNIGTLAKIVDWHQYEDGLLGITAMGRGRVKIVDAHKQSDGLNVGQLVPIEADPPTALPEKFEYMSRLARQLLDQLGTQYECVAPDFGDATWVASRLAEILPLSNAQRQACLEHTDPVARLELVAAAVRAMTRRNI